MALESRKQYGTVKTIGRYEILGELAVGGMAEILLARVRGPNGFERPVVIKRILRHLASDNEFVDMFLDEARIVSRLRHPNLVSIQELARERDELYMVMDYEEGESVSAVFSAFGQTGETLPPVVIAHMLAEAAAGLHSAHETVDGSGVSLGLVHRDVSPQNLFVTYEGHVKVLDFGIALAGSRRTRTKTGEIKGKLAYMSPEQVLGKRLDRRSDIFSLGIVLYELLTMRRLFNQSSDSAVLAAIVADPIVPPSRVCECPEQLERISMKALEADPAARFQTAGEMRAELLRYVREFGDDEPSDALARIMKGSFSERRAEKLAMLRAPEDETGDAVAPSTRRAPLSPVLRTPSSTLSAPMAALVSDVDSEPLGIVAELSPPDVPTLQEAPTARELPTISEPPTLLARPRRPRWMLPGFVLILSLGAVFVFAAYRSDLNHTSEVSSASAAQGTSSGGSGGPLPSARFVPTASPSPSASVLRSVTLQPSVRPIAPLPSASTQRSRPVRPTKSTKSTPLPQPFTRFD